MYLGQLLIKQLLQHHYNRDVTMVTENLSSKFLKFQAHCTQFLLAKDPHLLPKYTKYLYKDTAMSALIYSDQN